MKIIVQGLGKMGSQIAHKLTEDQHQVIVVNRSPEPVEKAKQFGAIPATNKQNAISYFNSEQVIIWLMLPADIIKSQVDEWLKILPKNSLIIDGGNSDFRNTQKLATYIENNNNTMIDIGTSGGIYGYKNGFSMMVGSNNFNNFKLIKPILISLTKPAGAYNYFGKAGSGHFVKMTHNAIEYGMMESLAEGYNFLKNGPYQEIDLAKVADVWQHHSVITSWLNELCYDILKTNPELNNIEGYVSESGEARWTLEAAKDTNISMPAISAAFNVRLNSQKGQINFATKLLAAMRNSFGGHKLNK